MRPPRLGGAPSGASAVLRNGRIYRGRREGESSFAEAVALRDGRVVAVGSDADVAALESDAAEVVDLGGRTVVPGLIDSHLHLVRAGLTWTEEVRWYEVTSLEAALRLVDERAATSPPGTWLRVVGGWHGGQFEEGRGPTHRELTDRYPDHPVYVQLLYEDAVLNEAGLRAAGIGGGVADPPRGRFERDAETGAPTGTVRGVGAFLHCLGAMPPPSDDDQVEGTRQVMSWLHRHGVVGGTDAGGLGMHPDLYRPLFRLWRDGGVTLRTRLFVGPLTRGEEARELADWLRFVHPGFGDDWLRWAGMGEIVVFGCHDLEGLTPFTVDGPSVEALETVLRDAAVAGWPVHMHSVLDATTDRILDVWERIAADHDLGRMRWSLAHLEPVSDRNLDRIAALGVGVAVQDRMVYRATDSAAVWGEGPVRRGPPLRSILDRGIPLGAGTDATRVTSPNPWVALWWMVTGRTVDAGPVRDSDECLDVATALDAYTVGSAWFTGEEHERGRLEPGSVADLAVLSDDPFDLEPDALRHLTADLTLVDGRPVHAIGPFSGIG